MKQQTTQQKMKNPIVAPFLSLFLDQDTKKTLHTPLKTWLKNPLKPQFL